MAVDFPNSPSNGDTTTINGVVYTYNSTKTAWETLESVDANAALSDNPPTNPNNGDLWFNSASGELLVRYNDGTSSQWVGVSGPAGPSVSLSAIAEDILPDADSSRSLGSPTKKWKDLYLSGSTIYLGDSATLSAAPGGEIILPSLKIGTGDNAVKLEANSSGGLETRAVVGGTTQSAKPAGGTTQVATLAAMQAIVNPSIGDLCSVTANNTIYMYNGTGFYKIATMVNESPSAITGVDGSYALATDGTATTITANSSDPEGRPLSWSYAVSSGSLTNGGGTTATIAQGTGVNTHVFTITPTTNSAYQGSFSITFNVTDNVNGAVSAVSSFTLAFIITNSRYTALSVKATNTGSNQTFDDASTSNHTITVAGDTTASTFSPYRHGGYAIDFDGTNDFLTVPDSTDFDIASGADFTLELWGFYPSFTTQSHIVDTRPSQGLYLSCSVGGGGSDDGKVKFYTNGGFRIITASTVPLNSWVHIALVRNSGTTKVYINGTADNNTYSDTHAYIAGDWYIGKRSPAIQAGSYMEGLFSDYRFVNGTAVYTSNFTPPTEPLTAITNTKILLGNLPYLKDQSTSNHTITIGGNPSLTPKSVFDNSPYSEASHGASAYFDGTGDWLYTVNQNIPTGSYQVDGWFYAKDTNNVCIFSQGTSGNSNRTGLWINGVDNGYISFYVGNNGSGGTGNNDASSWGNTTIPSNQWTHFATTYNGSQMELFINGISLGTASNTNDAESNTPFYIGAFVYNTALAFNGYMSDIRISDTVRNTSNFTPPTSPYTPDSNTKFLLNPETSISDLSQKSEIQCFADAAASTTQVKFAGTKSIYLDGTGDYIQINNYEDSWISGYTGDFTIEFWWYPTNVSVYQAILTAAAAFQLYTNNSTLNLALSSTNSYSPFWHPQSMHTMVNNTWHHIAIVRNGNIYAVYVDGVSKATTTTSAIIGTGTNVPQLGIYTGNSSPSQGYFQDFRITKGLARYTSNFTPPTAELEG